MKTDTNHDTRTGTVYFVQDFAETAIKIGVAVKPLQRLLALQVAHPYPLLPLGSCRGGYALERQIHGQFESDRLIGEWFRRTDALLNRIARLCKDHAGCVATHARLRTLVPRFSHSLSASLPARVGEG